MVSFASDYAEGAHPLILERLLRSNMEQLPGYGADRYCESAGKKIRAACQLSDAGVFFLTGGTQANQVVIASLLRSYQGVVAAKTGHITLHEAGAIEYSGHKVMELPSRQGKLEPGGLRNFLDGFWRDSNHEHMAFPGMVYLSWPTEYGTLYSRRELEEIHQICGEFQIPLFIDGARLGYGLMSRNCDLTLPNLAALCDVFTIGGTKAGALFGEAVVFSGRPSPEHFLTIVKQHGALLAKGRTLGIQFDTLFTNGLYFQISRHAIDMAEELKAAFQRKGYRFYLESPTNQQFLILEDRRMAELERHVSFSFWEKYDEHHTVARFATSWATQAENIRLLESCL